MTIYDFVKKNRVEVTMDDKGVYNCFINYKPNDKPWGSGSNILDALDDGVVRYMVNKLSIQPDNSKHEASADSKAIRKFLSHEALFIWYFFSRKYNIEKFVNYYEKLAEDTDLSYVNVLRFLYEVITQTIQDPSVEVVKDHPAIDNIFVQAMVYFESLMLEKYENNTLIKKLLDKIPEDNKEAFYKIQNTIELVHAEILKVLNEENNG